MRLPSTFCWPTQAAICEMLRSLPLEPALIICLKLLSRLSESMASLPACSRVEPSSLLIRFSTDSRSVMPGSLSNAPLRAFSIRPSTLRMASAMMRWMVEAVARLAMQSPMPTLKPFMSIQLLIRNWQLLKNAAATLGPYWFQMTWMRPPPDWPTVRLHIMPEMSSPRSILTKVSNAENSGSGSESLCDEWKRTRLTDGMMSDTSCLPVQSGIGLRMAGTGTMPSQSAIHMSRFITAALSRKTSRRVNLLMPLSASCTMPMTGRLLCGLTICVGTRASSSSSVRASSVCGTCRFISSPSKSALYGVVTDRLRRKVEYGMTLTRWPIIDILCSDGWRLNSTMSSSIRCRSTW
eukprot:Unigene5718_Nuclearia_a/m.17455 Unigene5718_Nuclearia_a/g.17455  ORF Unigene5718_Nuclearia_a/g.17455 Unigene5718_Nuclearia_a/m.17455 type:complete len:351 (+) Unigene5718_Nuclearia_a:973-2025(+)